MAKKRVPKSRMLTLAQLKKHHACSDAVSRFRAVFGDSVRVTMTLVKSAKAREFRRYAGWLAVRTLSPTFFYADSNRCTFDRRKCIGCTNSLTRWARAYIARK